MVLTNFSILTNFSCLSRIIFQFDGLKISSKFVNCVTRNTPDELIVCIQYSPFSLSQTSIPSLRTSQTINLQCRKQVQYFACEQVGKLGRLMAMMGDIRAMKFWVPIKARQYGKIHNLASGCSLLAVLPLVRILRPACLHVLLLLLLSMEACPPPNRYRRQAFGSLLINSFDANIPACNAAIPSRGSMGELNPWSTWNILIHPYSPKWLWFLAAEWAGTPGCDRCIQKEDIYAWYASGIWLKRHGTADAKWAF